MRRSHRVNPVSTLFVAAVAAMVTLAGCNAPPKHLQRSHGIRYYETGQIDLADQRLSAIVEKDTTDWKAMYYLGLVRLEQDRALDAELILEHDIPYNPLHDQGYTSIGCWPCTRAVMFGEDDRAGRWSGSRKRGIR